MTTVQVTSTKLLTGTAAPALEVQTLEGQAWKLADQKPQNYTMIVFYRGLHCPLCATQLTEIEQKLAELANLGIQAIAISGDTEAKAQQAQQDWQLQHLKIGYGLSPEAMRRWGLYLSRGAYENEPELFNEPAIFLVKPCGTIAGAIINSTPFARPHLADLMGGIDYILKNNYPIRGTEL